MKLQASQFKFSLQEEQICLEVPRNRRAVGREEQSCIDTYGLIQPWPYDLLL